MSQQVFQSTLVRLITSPEFRSRVIAEGGRALDPQLTERERTRLCLVAADPGMDINRTLHKGFRLGKLRSLAPLTCTLLGSRRLARELNVFWNEELPSSFYFLPEALAFCTFLQRRCAAGLNLLYLEEVAAYERAVLELDDVRGRKLPGESRKVTFHHDPLKLLGTLARGQRPRSVPVRKCILTGSVNESGQVTWQMAELL